MPVGKTRNMTRSRTPAVLKFDEPAGVHWYVALLGIQALHSEALASRLEKGFRFSYLQYFAVQMALSLGMVCLWVGLSSRTLERRRKEGWLNPAESDRLLTTTRIAGLALRLFEGDRDAAKRWLTSSQPTLGGSTPIEYSRTEFGAREVEHLIGRLEHGVIS